MSNPDVNMDCDSNPNTEDNSINRRLNMSKHYLNEETADVFFICGNDTNKERVPAHKFVVFSNSDVFDRMFHGSLPEKGNEIPIIDASPNGFRAFLRYFYFKEYKLNIDVVNEVMYLAKKYMIDEYFAACCDFLENGEHCDTGKHIIISYELALAHELVDLQNHFERKIRHNGRKVFGSEYIRSITIELLKRILQIDCVGECAKLAFDACMEWAEEACNRANVDPSVLQNRQKLLRDCLDHIEFGAMRHDDLVQCAKTYVDLFTPWELRRFITMIAAKCPTPFNKDQMIRYNIGKMSLDIGEIEANSMEELYFNSNEKILLGGLEVIPLFAVRRSWKAKFNGMLRILQISADKHDIVVSQEAIEFTPKKGRFAKHPITLRQPIIIEPSSKYGIQLIMGSESEALQYRENTISVPEGCPIRILEETKTSSFIAELLCNKLD